MCVTFGQAELQNTIVYAHRFLHEGQEAHVLGYQNRANSDGPNAMILPLPAVGALGPSNVIDTREAPWLLKDMDALLRTTSRSLAYKSVGSQRPAVQVFDSGSYTVVLTREAAPEAIHEALQQVPVAKRPPTPSLGFFATYGRLYPGWPIAICCWSGKIDAEPLMWWYRPRYLTHLFLPAVDAHDGGPPVPGNTRRDHTLIWGSDKGPSPRFRDPLPESLRPFIASKVQVRRPSGWAQNGDYWINQDHMSEGFPGTVSPM